MEWLAPVRTALAAAPRPVSLFFRDDDVGWRHDRLRPLLDVFAERMLPLDLAVIPAALDAALAAELTSRGSSIGLHQHGFAHLNHEHAGRKSEFGPSRGKALQRRDIQDGAERLARLLGPRLDPIFTPPWNRCARATGECLLELGFHALSRESEAEPLDLPGLQEVPVHVDWVRLAPPELGARLAGAIRRGGPVGLMFHHAEMDAADRRRAAALLTLLAGHACAEPRPMRELMGERR
jgi:hypothetical protein